MKDIKLENLMPTKDGLIILRKRFGLKNVKITGEAASVDQEAAEEFLDAIKKKIIKKKGYLCEQIFLCR